MDDTSEGLAFPPVYAHPGWRYRDGAVFRPRLPASPPCEICGAAVLTVQCRRICLRCGYLAGCPQM